MTLELIANINATVQHKWQYDGQPGGPIQGGTFSFDSSQGDIKNKIENANILSGVTIQFTFAGGTIYIPDGLGGWMVDPTYSAGTATTAAIPAQSLPPIPVFIVPTAIYTQGNGGLVVREKDVGTMSVYAQQASTPFNFVLIPGTTPNVIISDSGQLLKKVKAE